MKLTKITKYIAAIIIFITIYRHTTATLVDTNSIIATELCKLSAVTIMTYIWMCALLPIGRSILKLIKWIGEE